MYNERAEGSDLVLSEMIRHIYPRTSKWIAKRVIRQIVQSILNGFYRRESTSRYQRIIDSHLYDVPGPFILIFKTEPTASIDKAIQQPFR